jgi:hypothetical protein
MNAVAGLHAIPGPFTIALNEQKFVAWLVRAASGDAIAYYRGHLAHDRMPSAGILDKTERATLTAVAHRVFVAHQQGLVVPVQKRLGPHDWLYLAIRAGRFRGPATASTALISSSSLEPIAGNAFRVAA